MNTKKTKSNQPDAVLRKGLQPKSEPVRLAEEVPGKALESIKQQVGVNGNPKKRTGNSSGIGAKAAADVKELKK
jgi:hypothetical protein